MLVSGSDVGYKYTVIHRLGTTSNVRVRESDVIDDLIIVQTAGRL